MNKYKIKHITKPTTTSYYICYDGEAKDSITAYGTIDPGNQMTTGQPVLEEYKKKSKWLEELLVYGIIPEEQE